MLYYTNNTNTGNITALGTENNVVAGGIVGYETTNSGGTTVYSNCSNTGTLYSTKGDSTGSIFGMNVCKPNDGTVTVTPNN